MTTASTAPRLSPALRAAFAAAVAVILGATAISYRNAMAVYEESQWVAHTLETQGALSVVLSGLQDAEIGERGFIIAGNEAYLQPHVAAEREVPEQLRRLGHLLSEKNIEQQQRLRNLESHSSTLLGWLRETIEVRRRGGFAPAQDRVREGTGKREMDTLRDIIHEMEVAEGQLLQQRAQRVHAAVRAAAVSFATTAVLATVLIGLLYGVLRRHLRIREAAEREREALLLREQTARTQAEKGYRELENANRAKDAFLATVSHELRTPLSPILLWTAMLERGGLSEDQYRRAYETIARCAKAQAQLIEDLLDVSRIVAGKMRLAVRPVELGHVIQSAIEVVRPAAEAKNIRLQTVLDTETAPISGDPERLQQVIWNLLSNAIKFTPKGGRVTVVLERVNSHVEVAVSDTGQGIAAEFLPYVFDRFRQEDAGSTRQYTGLGLGLAIVRHIVEAHGGTVHAESPGLGKGSVFTVKLPLMLIRRSAGEAERRHPTETTFGAYEYPTLNGLRVLVVDDEPDCNEVVRALLSSCGAEVRLAASTLEALDIVAQWTPQILVSDIGMPDHDGYSLIAKLRARGDDRAGIPAIALTAYASVEDRVRLLSAGFQMHVPKPVEPAELLAVVANLVRRE